ncbi:hypothetical protein DFP72DRAFT_846036 [Ephemerocybe angulata]|uniref:Uncharacterized protein n=1 Tax=Ephemerocybe angulata TaxID=980116 RepID=A0A8H6I395_9AGAR|nr:hypothetical protein DFP72DRAFT_846036 [Tulosesus angulatus]
MGTSIALPARPTTTSSTPGSLAAARTRCSAAEIDVSEGTTEEGSGSSLERRAGTELEDDAKVEMEEKMDVEMAGRTKEEEEEEVVEIEIDEQDDGGKVKKMMKDHARSVSVLSKKEDVHMQSPSPPPEPAHGSSRSTGGILRGNRGVLNHADAAHKYSHVQDAKSVAGFEQSIYTWDPELHSWTAQGTFAAALEASELVEWTVNNNIAVLCMLLSDFAPGSDHDRSASRFVSRSVSHSVSALLYARGLSVTSATRSRPETPFSIPTDSAQGIMSSQAANDIHLAFERYEEMNAAITRWNLMVSEGTWPKDFRIQKVDIQRVFFQKSTMHSYSTPFTNLTSMVSQHTPHSAYVNMQLWLRRDTAAPSDQDVWDTARQVQEEAEVLAKKNKKKKKKASAAVLVMSMLVHLIHLISVLCSPTLALALVILALASPALAAPPTLPFPNITFKVFSDCIQEQFFSDISLSTVLVLLYSLTENPEFLNLHGWQQQAKVVGEHGRTITTWMAMFSRLMLDSVVLEEHVEHTVPAVNALSLKLDQMVSVLQLNMYKPSRSIYHHRKPISYKNEETDEYDRRHLNGARYLKIGRELWADRTFSNSILCATYSFHSSTSAFMDFWNESVGRGAGVKISHCQVWHAYILESLRMIAGDQGVDLVLPDHYNIDQIMAAAYDHLGADDVIKAAEGHAFFYCWLDFNSNDGERSSFRMSVENSCGIRAWLPSSSRSLLLWKKNKTILKVQYNLYRCALFLAYLCSPSGILDPFTAVNVKEFFADAANLPGTDKLSAGELEQISTFMVDSKAHQLYFQIPFLFSPLHLINAADIGKRKWNPKQIIQAAKEAVATAALDVAFSGVNSSAALSIAAEHLAMILQGTANF